MRTMPAATEAAEPPEEPPGTRVRSTGLSTGPHALYSFELPIANSSQFVLPTSTAPASRSRVIDRRLVRAHVALEDARAARRLQMRGRDVVLRDERHAGERARRGGRVVHGAARRASARSSSVHRMQLSPVGPASPPPCA